MAGTSGAAVVSGSGVAAEGSVVSPSCVAGAAVGGTVGAAVVAGGASVGFTTPLPWQAARSPAEKASSNNIACTRFFIPSSLLSTRLP